MIVPLIHATEEICSENGLRSNLCFENEMTTRTTMTFQEMNMIEESLCLHATPSC
jgi:hypothetical protein